MNIDDLRNAKTNSDRNDAALTILNFYEESSKALIEMLSNKWLAGSRGTILYVLDEMNIKVPLPILIDIILGDEYSSYENNEEKQEAVSQLFKLTEKDISEKDCDSALLALYFWPIKPTPIMNAMLYLREFNYPASPRYNDYEGY